MDSSEQAGEHLNCSKIFYVSFREHGKGHRDLHIANSLELTERSSILCRVECITFFRFATASAVPKLLVD